MASVYTRYTDYENGIFPDMPGDLIPEGGVSDALNMIFDKPGKARKRGGTYGTSSGVRGARWLASISPTTGDPTVMAASIYTDGSSHVQAKIGRPDLTHVAPSANDNETYMAFFIAPNNDGDINVSVDGYNGLTQITGATGHQGDRAGSGAGTGLSALVGWDIDEASHTATDLPDFRIGVPFFASFPANSYCSVMAIGDTSSVGVLTTSDTDRGSTTSTGASINASTNTSGGLHIAAGDMLVTFVAVNGQTITSVPAGFTLVHSFNHSGVNAYVYQYIYDGTEAINFNPGNFNFSGSGPSFISHTSFISPSSHTMYVVDEGVPGSDPTPASSTFGIRFDSTVHGGGFSSAFWDGVITNYPADVAPASLTVSGRPFEFEGFLFWPLKSLRKEANWMVVYGGVYLDSGTLAAYHSTGDISLVLTAGSQLVTATGTSFLTNLEVGQVVTIRDSLTAPTFAFVSRVTKVVDDISFYVESKLPKTLTLHNADALWCDPLIILPDHYALGNLSSDIAVAWQYRIVMGAPATWVAPSASQGPTDYTRTIIWTTLPEAFDLGVSSNAGLYIGGLTAALRESVLPNNFLTIPEAQPLVALAPLFSDQLVYFGKSQMWAISGNFVTENADTNATDSLSVKNISRVIGCLSQNSLQQSARGIIFAGSDGVYAYNGSEAVSLMNRRIANTWRNLIQAGNTITGSGIIRTNHYAISLTNGLTYMVNLDNMAWTVLSNVALFDALAADPADPSKTWGALYGDIAGDPSTWGTFTGGQIVRLDTMFTPGPAYKQDANGTTVQSSLETRTYVEGDPEIRKIYQTLMYEYYLKGAGTVTAKADTTIEPSRADYKAIGVLPQNVALAITGATNASPIVVTTTDSHGYASGDKVSIRGIVGNTAANSDWIIDVLTSKTFSLRTSTGNAAYTSGGTVKASDARSFHATPKLHSGFGITHKIEQTGLCDEFEVLGTKHGFRPERSGRDA